MVVPVLRQHLQGVGADRSLGLLRRVQPDLSGGIVRGRSAGEVRARRYQG